MTLTTNLWRILRFGPALYRASRKLGFSRRYSLRVALTP